MSTIYTLKKINVLHLLVSVSFQEHKTLALRKDGIGVVLDSELPYLLALHDDILSTGMKLYHLKVSVWLQGNRWVG